MADIRSYWLQTDGSIIVATRKGQLRPATDSEWIALWLRDPRITLARGL